MQKITIIMPCLNVVQYFKECIDSVVDQTIFNELEVIVIDAGSTDGTYEIAAFYANNYENIHLISSNRKSYGYQVNLGILMAKSPYIAILETDDLVNRKMYEILYREIEENQVDYVKADYEMFYVCRNGKRIVWDIKSSKDSSLYNRILDVTNNVYLYVHDFSVWRGIYRRDFLIDNKILFNESKGAAYQDIGFSHKLHSCSKRALYIPKKLYRYRAGREQASVNSGRGLVYSYEEFKQLFNTWDKQKLCLKGTYEAMLNSFLEQFGLLSTFYASTDKNITESIAWFGLCIENGIKEGIISEEEITTDLGEGALEYFRSIQKNPEHEIKKLILEKNDQIHRFSELRFLQKPIYIFGAGYYGKNVLRLFDSLNVEISYFLDNGAAENQMIAGYNVVCPKDAVIEKNAKVIIANKNHKDTIKKQLLDMGLTEENVIEYKQY